MNDEILVDLADVVSRLFLMKASGTSDDIAAATVLAAADEEEVVFLVVDNNTEDSFETAKSCR